MNYFFITAIALFSIIYSYAQDKTSKELLQLLINTTPEKKAPKFPLYFEKIKMDFKIHEGDQIVKWSDTKINQERLRKILYVDKKKSLKDYKCIPGKREEDNDICELTFADIILMYKLSFANFQYILFLVDNPSEYSLDWSFNMRYPNIRLSVVFNNQTTDTLRVSNGARILTNDTPIYIPLYYEGRKYTITKTGVITTADYWQNEAAYDYEYKAMINKKDPSKLDTVLACDNCGKRIYNKERKLPKTFVYIERYKVNESNGKLQQFFTKKYEMLNDEAQDFTMNENKTDKDPLLEYVND